MAEVVDRGQGIRLDSFIILHIHRFTFRYALRSCCVAIYLGACAGIASAKAPNIVVIQCDDAGYNSFGFSAALNGKTAWADTPNLDALASQSVVMSQGYTASSLCSTSRVGLITGQHGTRYGFEGNLDGSTSAFTVAGNSGLTAQQRTIAQHLKGLGYSTGLVGKWHLGYAQGLNRPLDKGFDEFFGFLGGGRQYFQSGGDAASMYRGNTNIESQWRSQGDPSKYDPVRGRYTTDAFGEEAVSFIDDHADDENPFLLYLTFNAAHSPWGAKQADLDRFEYLADPTKQTQAAIVYAMDRSIGEVVSALQANGVYDDTIIVFTNDDGPESLQSGDSSPYRQQPGTLFEGEVRTPFLMKLPGTTPGVYDQPVTALDVVPTLYAAAGGDVAQIATDGYNVLPYLRGEAVDDPNKVRFWRLWDSYTVRKGDWKLTTGYINNPSYFLFNMATDATEQNNRAAFEPQVVAELLSELTHWEATQAKPRWAINGIRNQNEFDHFVFRNDGATTTNWNTAGAWYEAGTSDAKTVNPADSYANGIFEFQVRSDADYVATNNMKRLTKQTFMLNELRLTGTFAGLADHQGRINGNALLFVNDLDGNFPQLRLDATATSATTDFTFQVDNELQLLNHLVITGDGTQNFIVNGQIRDYYEPLQPNVTTPHHVLKTGTSTVSLRGNNTFRGELHVVQGLVRLDATTSAIHGAASISIYAEGGLQLSSGTIAVDWIRNAQGGSFEFQGGTLSVNDFEGDLTNSGGIFSPGTAPTVTSISGSFHQQAGTTLMTIGGAVAGSQYDSLLIEGAALLGGALEVELLDDYLPTAGRTFQLLTAAGGIDGIFAQTVLPTLPGGLFWNVMYGENSVLLAVAPTTALTTIPGDFNLDGTVDTADYTVWRDRLNTSSSIADANFDGLVTAADYALWKAHRGFSLTNAGFAAIAVLSVPEPTWLATIALVATGIAPLPIHRRRSPQRNAHRRHPL